MASLIPSLAILKVNWDANQQNFMDKLICQRVESYLSRKFSAILKSIAQLRD